MLLSFDGVMKFVNVYIFYTIHTHTHYMSIYIYAQVYAFVNKECMFMLECDCLFFSMRDPLTCVDDMFDVIQLCCSTCAVC